MILCEEIPSRDSIEEKAFVVTYRTQKRAGRRRFGGYRARDKATTFANEILSELLSE